MDDWVSVDEDMPLRSPQRMRCSANIQIKLVTGEVVTGFFVTDDEEWYNYNTAKRIPDNQVEAWRSI